jgi:hypothetical protein
MPDDHLEYRVGGQPVQRDWRARLLHEQGSTSEPAGRPTARPTGVAGKAGDTFAVAGSLMTAPSPTS